MKKEVDKVFYTSLISSTILILIGGFLLFSPDTTVKIIFYVLGGLIAVLGAIGILKFFTKTEEIRNSKYGLAYGIVCLVVAILFIFFQDKTSKLFPYILGLFIIVNSAIKVEYVIKLNKAKNTNWSVTLLILIFSITLGLLLIFNPLKEADFFIQLIGMILMFFATLDIIQSYTIKCNIDELLVLPNPKEDIIYEVKEK